MGSLGWPAPHFIAVVGALAVIGLVSYAARTLVVVVPLVRLLVLGPLLALGLVFAALPVSIGIAALVERLLPLRSDRRPQLVASKARGRLSFTTEAAWSVVQLRSLWEAADPTGASATKPPLHPSMSASLQAPVDAIFALIMRDFVRAWYNRLSPSAAFPNELESTIREALGALIDRAVRVDFANVLVGRIVPLVTAHLDGFARAEATLSGSRRQSTLLGGTGSAAEGLDVFLVQAFGPSGGLHKAISGQAVDARPAQEAHLRSLVEGILARILPERNKSPIVDIVAREVVTCAVFMPIVELLSDPDFWNRLLDEQVRPGRLCCAKVSLDSAADALP
jgi:sorting nexin-25